MKSNGNNMNNVHKTKSNVVKVSPKVESTDGTDRAVSPKPTHSKGTAATTNNSKNSAKNTTSITLEEVTESKSSTVHNDSGSNDESVMVVVRVRPPNQRETSANSGTCVEMIGDKSIKISRKEKLASSTSEDKTFSFDRVFGQGSTQDEVYEATGRSGKTFTMEGDEQHPGVMKKIGVDLFDYFNSRSNQIESNISVSYLEIYNDNLVDLMAKYKGLSTQDAELKIREHPVKGIHVNNLIQIPVSRYEDVLSVIEHGTEFRTKGETKMNAVSSRSHSVLTFFIEQQETGDTNGFSLRQSKLHMVDLAGSERAGSTGAEGKRLMEGAKINQSLSSLGNVINALAMNKPYVPYRDSKLTRLLQDSLGGNSITLMICALSPASINLEESLSTLKFADRAKQIKNRVKLARDPKLAKIADLMAENKRLRLRVEYLEGLLEQNQIPYDAEINHSSSEQENYLSNDGVQVECDPIGKSQSEKKRCCIIS